MKSTRPMVLVTAGLALLALQPLAARAELLEISDMFVFGDSLSDGGNSGLLTQAAAGVVFPPPPYAGGRYSNGPTAVEQLWNLYNTDGGLQPSLAGGTNFAIGGATSGTENFNQINPNVPAALHPVFAGLGADVAARGVPGLGCGERLRPGHLAFRRLAVPQRRVLRERHRQLPGLRARPVVANVIANIASTHPGPGRGRRAALPRAEPGQPRRCARVRRRPARRGTEPVSIAFNTNLAAQLALLDAMLGGRDHPL